MEYNKHSAKIFYDDYWDSQLEKIEWCGRKCYKSEDRIANGTAKRFVSMMARDGHMSVLEHGSLYWTVRKDDYKTLDYLTPIMTSKYSEIEDIDDYYLIYTNYRVVFENNKELADILLNNGKLPDGIEEFVPASENRRITVRILCDKVVETEIVRHRTGSFTITSTRYINPVKRGFKFLDYSEVLKNRLSVLIFKAMTKLSALSYKLLISLGNKPDTARSVMLFSNFSEVVMTMSIKNWKHFFELRNSPKANVIIREIAKEIVINFKKDALI